MAKLPETIEVKVTDLGVLKECEDCVSRDDVFHCFNNSNIFTGTFEDCETIKQYLEDVLEKIDRLSPVQPMRKRGKWINREIYGVTSPLLPGYECSLCGWIGQRIFKYCPMCGAGMFEDSE